MKAGWITRPLSEVAEIVGGGTPARDNAAYWDGGIPWVTPTDLPARGDGIGFIASTKQTINEAGLAGSSAVLLPKGAVLFSSRATIGKVGVAEVPVATNQGFANLIPHKGVSSRFLAYLLWAKGDEIASLAGSTTFREVTRGNLRRFEVAIPDLGEQERVVKLLDAAEELRRLRAAADRRTADLIPALFYDMFGDPRSPRGQTPTMSLADACTRITDGVHKTPTYVGAGVPFLRVTDIQDSGIDWISVKRIPRSEYDEITRNVKPERGDVLYSKNGTVGIAKEVTWDEHFAHFVSLALLKPRCDLVHPTYLTAFLNTPFALQQAKAFSKTGTVTNLHLVEIKKIRLPVPHLDLQVEFVGRLTAVNRLETQQAASRRRLDDLFQSMLHRAFRGEL